MWISLLLDQQGRLIAGGWACDQIPLGQRYWREVLGISKGNNSSLDNCETAIVELKDRDLVDQILLFHLDPTDHQLSAIMAGLDQPLHSRQRVVVSKFAA
jgi:hypothetical protein